MDRNSINWKGYIPAITTPFEKSGELNETMLSNLLEWLSSEGMHGIIVAGTTGEWFSLDAKDRRRLFTVTGRKLAGTIPLIAGCNAYTADAAIRNIEVAEGAGLDGILLTPPPYVRPARREILEFYRTVSDSSNLPICVYNWPPGTNIDMDLDLLTEISKLEKVVAIKNSTGNWAHFKTVFAALKDQVRIYGIPMSAEGAQMVLDDGADGLMGAGAVLGREQPEFFNALWRGDLPAALEVGERDQTLMQAWFNSDYTAKFGSAQAVFKTALNLQGLPGGYPRAPILPLEPKEVAIIKRTLVKLGRIRDDAA